MDSKHNIVVNVRMSTANVNDVEPIAEILFEQLMRDYETEVLCFL